MGKKSDYRVALIIWLSDHESCNNHLPGGRRLWRWWRRVDWWLPIMESLLPIDGWVWLMVTGTEGGDLIVVAGYEYLLMVVVCIGDFGGEGKLIVIFRGGFVPVEFRVHEGNFGRRGSLIFWVNWIFLIVKPSAQLNHFKYHTFWIKISSIKSSIWRFPNLPSHLIYKINQIKHTKYDKADVVSVSYILNRIHLILFSYSISL